MVKYKLQNIFLILSIISMILFISAIFYFNVTKDDSTSTITYPPNYFFVIIPLGILTAEMVYCFITSLDIGCDNDWIIEKSLCIVGVIIVWALFNIISIEVHKSSYDVLSNLLKGVGLTLILTVAIIGYFTINHSIHKRIRENI